MKYNFTVYGNPATKKNSSRIVHLKNGRTVLIPSKNYKDYEKNAKQYLQALEISKPCNIKALYFMKTRRRVDITNLHSALHDILTTHKVIDDDNCQIVVGTDGSRVFYDKENPRTEIEIEILEGYNDPFKK